MKPEIYRSKRREEKENKMNWTTLNFGRYKGMTRPQIIFRDPDWFLWATQEQLFKGALKSEAEMLSKRMQRIPSRLRKKSF
jgi:hypothetical protein